jgi:hypothetical protein
MASLFSEKEIECPAAPDVRSRPTEMAQDVGVVAPGFFQGVGQDGEAFGGEFARWKDALIVGGSSEPEDGRRLPRGVEKDRAERVAADVLDKITLNNLLGNNSSPIDCI